MKETVFETEFEKFLKRQKSEADGQRLEMLCRDLTGTKKLLRHAILPVLGTFDDLVLEYEMVGASGVKIYGDVFHRRLATVFEEENYVTHAEKVTRPRFSFERARARSVGIRGYTYFPYCSNELETKAEFCQNNLRELIAGKTGSGTIKFMELSVYEREVLRHALSHYHPFQLAEASLWLQLSKESSRKVLRKLELRNLIQAVGGSSARCHAFIITEEGIDLMSFR